MKITVVAVGRARAGSQKSLTEHYCNRFDGLSGALGLAKLEITEVEEKRPIKGAERQAREATLLLDATPRHATVIALDERGKSLTSAEFAKLVANLRDTGTRDLAFLIGGADGFSSEIKSRASRALSFGPATWPHMLVRTMLAEQLYRAATIMAGHPYHKI